MTPNVAALVHDRKLILEGRRGSPWADEMVLNPGLIRDPQTRRLHLLFRATGPWPQKRLPGKPLPYPIFLGYAWSDDEGQSWQSDFTCPALAPALCYEPDALYIRNRNNERVVNHANGCIEDPRIFFLEGKCLMICACRLMPPGPFWEHDDPVQCAPAWTQQPNPFGKAATANVTVNVLYEVDLARLTRRDYEHAFQYVTHLTNPELDENRDVLLFPEKLQVNGRKQYVCIHRPFFPELNPPGRKGMLPSIYICAAHDLKKLWKERETQTILAEPLFPWEANRIAGSAPLLRISPTEWLLCYHGREETKLGYTQSFLILEEQPDALPRVKHRCPDRILYAQESWELPNKSPRPCVFVTGMERLNEKELLVAYGASDERVGTALIDFHPLVAHVRQFDAEGRTTHE